MTRWRRYGHDRFYADSEQGEQLGWHDLRSGATLVVTHERALCVREEIARWRVATSPVAIVVQTSGGPPAHELLTAVHSGAVTDG